MKRYLLLLPLAVLLSACSFPVIGRKAGLLVTADPQANIQVNQEPSGLSPFRNNDLKAGEYDIKIIPQDPSLQPWESRVSLTAGTLTIVERHLAVDPTKAHGFVLHFTKTDKKDSAEISITSIPNSVSVLIDSQPAGFTPTFNNSITPGTHTITLTAPGYQDEIINANIQAGHQLNIDSQLASQSVEVPLTPTSTPTPTPPPDPSPTSSPGTITPLPSQATSAAITRPYVEILSTPTGWLRVRQEPTTSSSEIAKVNPGDKFPYLDSQSGWYQIQLTDQSGWISGTYAKLFQ